KTNDGILERVGRFEIVYEETSYEYYVIQKGNDSIVVNAGRQYADIDEKTISFEVMSSAEFKVTSDADWIQLESSEITDSILLEDGKTFSDYKQWNVTLSVEPNSGDVRYADVKVSAGEQESIVKVAQMGNLVADYTKDFYRRSSVLEFTATWCKYCYLMAGAIHDAMSSSPDRIVPMVMHGSDSEEALAYGKMEDHFYHYDLIGYPTSIFNGNAVLSLNSNYQTTVDALIGLSDEAVSIAPSRTSIGGRFYLDGNEAVAELSIAAKESGTYRLSVFLLEDGMVYPQKNAGDNYVHNNIVREAFHSETFGDEIPLTSGSVKDIRLQIPIPSKIENRANMHIVAYITRDDSYIGKIAEAEYGDFGAVVDNIVNIPLDGFALFEYE
ncbi:MAG TPA: Omp28-related outer membrane protein, partial [Candidatus Coprenecus pullicola]|nr:Omp28-related outer membrane protein [Candidatus Coprenecus pullicola]